MKKLSVILVLLLGFLGIPSASLAEDTALDKNGWTTSESSWWWNTPANCDGRTFHIIDGVYTWSNPGDPCGWGRSFYSPAYPINNHGQWFRIDFGASLTLERIELYQYKTGMKLSSLTNPDKYSRYLKELEVEFSDGSSETLEFPEGTLVSAIETITEANFSSPHTTSWIKGTIISFYDDYSMAALNALEIDLFGSPEDPNDLDGDGIVNAADNCPTTANLAQLDRDHDGVGDSCDPDIDGDGFANGDDNCPDANNPLQSDGDLDGLGDACDPKCNPRLSVKSGWLGSQSSWWLQPWRNNCDGKAQNAIDGNYRFSYSNYWACSGDLSPRSFFSPRYTGSDVGAWMKVEFPELYTVNGITLVQLKERTYVSGLVRPKKFTAYLKDATLGFSDGSSVEVTFPQRLEASVNFPETVTGSVNITARSFYPTVTSNPSWFVTEADFSGAPGDVDLNLEICSEPAPPPADTDGDGVPDDLDLFPTDPTEWADTDGDGIGDNADTDDDNDGIDDDVDTNPTEPDALEDSDNDGIPNQDDPDDDNDGVNDEDDAFPKDPSEWADSDGDGVGDNTDNCTSAYNPQQTDADSDGIGDPCDRPLANAGLDQSTHPGTVVTLDGSGSIDPDEEYPLQYAWVLHTKPVGSLAELSGVDTSAASLVPDVMGDYTVNLTVTDNNGHVSEIDEVVISTVNTPPTADAGSDQAITSTGEWVSLSGAASYDLDGDPLIAYSWTLISRPVGSDAELTAPGSMDTQFIADRYGDYIVELTVTDTYGAVSAADRVTMSLDNVPPVADAGDNQSVYVGDTVYLDGGRSMDANNDPLSYRWSMVMAPEGSSAILSNPDSIATSLVANLSGTYTVSLIVNDGQYDSVPSIVTISALSRQDAVVQLVQDAIEVINGLGSSVFKNKNLAKPFTNKLNAVLAKLEDGDYQAAVDKLEHDILSKMDGCALAGHPDKADWITTCDAQAEVYSLIEQAIAMLRSLL